MKTKLFIAGIGIILVAAIFAGCNKGDNNHKATTQIVQTITLHNVTVNGIHLPNGTKAIRVNKSKVKFVFPKGIQLWFVDNNNSLQKIEESDYTCSCSSSGGCDVVLVKGEYGCMQGSCTGSCTGTPGKGLTEKKFAFVDLNQKISPVQNQKEYDSLKYIPAFLLFDTQTKQILRTYAKSIYKKNVNIDKLLQRIDSHQGFNSDVNNIVYVEMKMFGYKFLYGIYVNDLTKEKSTNNLWDIAPGKIKCTCESGSSDCTPGSIFGVKYCKGGTCTKCKMSD